MPFQVPNTQVVMAPRQVEPAQDFGSALMGLSKQMQQQDQFNQQAALQQQQLQLERDKFGLDQQKTGAELDQSQVALRAQIASGLNSVAPEKRAEVYGVIRQQMPQLGLPEQYSQEVVDAYAGAGVSAETRFKYTEDQKAQANALQSKVGKESNALATDLGKLKAAGASDDDPRVKAVQSELDSVLGKRAQEQAKLAEEASKNSFDKSTTLRKEYEAQSKDFRTVRDAYERIKTSSQDVSAAGDLALIFSYMKTLDPQSVVRETEFANAQNAGGVPDRIRAQYNKVLRGERLSEAQRADFLSQADNLYKAQFKAQETLQDSYRDIAKRNNLNADDVVTPMSNDAMEQATVKAKNAGVPQQEIDSIAKQSDEYVKKGLDPAKANEIMLKMINDKADALRSGKK